MTSFKLGDNVTHVLLYILYSGFNVMFGTFGIVANILNIIIYIRLGFKESINVSLLGLAVTDLLAILFTVPAVGFFNPAVLPSENLTYSVWDFFYVIEGFPISVLFRIACFITVFITLERCLCFLIPLKVKTVVTPKRSAIVIISIYALMLGTLIPSYFAVKLDAVVYSNRSVVRMVYARDAYTSRRLLIFMFSVNTVVQLVALVALIFVNIALAFAIKRQVKWRESSIATVPQLKGDDSGKNKNKLSVVSQRSRRLGQMIQFLSLILLVCYLPSSILFIASLAEYEFFIGRKFHNEFYVSQSFGVIVQSFNSCVNIFFYYRMNTKYRNAFNKFIGLQDQSKVVQTLVSQAQK